MGCGGRCSEKLRCKLVGCVEGLSSCFEECKVIVFRVVFGIFCAQTSFEDTVYDVEYETCSGHVWSC